MAIDPTANVAFGITSYPRGAIGIIEGNIVGLKQGIVDSATTTVGVNTFRYEKMLEPSTTIDGFVNDNFTSVITTAKNSILSLGGLTAFQSNAVYYNSVSAAESALDNIYGGNGNATTVISKYNIYTNVNFPPTTAANGSIPEGATIGQEGSGATGIAVSAISTPVNQPYALLVKNVSGTFVAGAANTITVSGAGFTSPSSINYVGAGDVYQDIVLVTNFPKLEPPDTSAETPFTGRQSKILTNSNKGLGVANTYYANAVNDLTFGDFVDSVDSLPKLGEVLAIDPGSGNVAQITTQRQNIGVLRTGVVSYVGGGDTVKRRKKGYAVNVWTLSNNRDNFNADITGLQAAIGVLEDPAMGGPY